MMKFKLGKLAPRQDKRTLKFKSYFAQLPPIPTSADWTGKLPQDLGMLLNDSVGDCTCAGAGHLEMVWSSNTGTEFIPTDDQILADYSAITGYTPSDPNSDTGADLLTVLNYWRSKGIAGNQIQYYAQIDTKNLQQVRAAIALFGGAYIGVQLPDNAEQAFSDGQPWSDTSDANIEGGHCVVLTSYTPNNFTCITWGARQVMSNDWFSKYVDEAYAIISPQWLEANGTNSPAGLNLSQLEADLKLV